MRHFAISVFTLLFIESLSAEPVILKKDNPTADHGNAIPVNVDIDASNLLMMRFHKSCACSVIVTGPEGIVYQQSISADNYTTIMVDLRGYTEGDYTITFYDKDGNVLDRTFWLNAKNIKYNF